MSSLIEQARRNIENKELTQEVLRKVGIRCDQLFSDYSEFVRNRELKFDVTEAGESPVTVTISSPSSNERQFSVDGLSDSLKLTYLPEGSLANATLRRDGVNPIHIECPTLKEAQEYLELLNVADSVFLALKNKLHVSSQ